MKNDILPFDAHTLFLALDAERHERGLSWAGVTRSIWDQWPVLNAVRPGHPLAASTILNLDRNGDTTCQHGIIYVQWLGRAPEEFLSGWEVDPEPYRVPPAIPDKRLRWRLELLAEGIAAARRREGMSMAEVAEEIGCTVNQLNHFAHARYGTGMGLAMRTAQWLGRPAKDFVRDVGW